MLHADWSVTRCFCFDGLVYIAYCVYLTCITYFNTFAICYCRPSVVCRAAVKIFGNVSAPLKLIELYEKQPCVYDYTASECHKPCLLSHAASLTRVRVRITRQRRDKIASVTSIYKSSAVAEMGDRLATIGMGRKWGGAGFPSNTVWLGLRPTSLPSGILIHPTVWPQL